MVGLSKHPEAKAALREGSAPASVLTALRTFPGEYQVALYGLQALTNLISDLDDQAAEKIRSEGSDYVKQLLVQGRDFMKVNEDICGVIGRDNQACEVVMTVMVAHQKDESVVKFGCNAVTFLLEVPANKAKLGCLKCKQLLVTMLRRGLEAGMTKPYEEAVGVALQRLEDETPTEGEGGAK